MSLVYYSTMHMNYAHYLEFQLRHWRILSWMFRIVWLGFLLTSRICRGVLIWMRQQLLDWGRRDWCMTVPLQHLAMVFTRMISLLQAQLMLCLSTHNEIQCFSPQFWGWRWLRPKRQTGWHSHASRLMRNLYACLQI